MKEPLTRLRPLSRRLLLHRVGLFRGLLQPIDPPERGRRWEAALAAAGGRSGGGAEQGRDVRVGRRRREEASLVGGPGGASRRSGGGAGARAVGVGSTSAEGREGFFDVSMTGWTHMSG